MRVIRRLGRDEGGAVIVLYALALVVILGMLALTLDLGRAVAAKRDLVNAADAGALGAAQECAIQRNTVSAQTVAQNLTAQNREGATVASFSAPDCETPNLTGLRSVTVGAQYPLEYFVASVLGFDSVSVGAEATAIYGPSVTAHAVPVTVNWETLQACGIGTGSVPAPGSTFPCDLSYPKDLLSEPRWGVLDLAEWGDPDAAPCMVSADEVSTIIVSGGSFEQLEIAQGGTYDCLDNGLSNSVWETLEGRTLIFPVLDVAGSTGEIPPPAGPTDCMGDEPECVIDTALVIAWVQLTVPPGGVTKHGDDVFVQVEWAGNDLQTSGLPGTGPDFGLYAIRLVD